MERVTGYAAFAKGGYNIEPYFIDRLHTAENVVIMRSNPLVVCEQCELDDNNYAQQPDQNPGLTNTAMTDSSDGTAENTIPENTDLLIPVYEEQLDPMVVGDGEVNNDGDIIPQRVAKRIVSPQNIYIMNSILRDVIKRGTGKRALVLKRGDIAGKTGTTNDQQDAWFSGFNPDVVTTAWVGFDEPHTLGHNEYGGRAALPMWIEYMAEALKGLPEQALETPPGLVNVRIDPETGLLVGAGFPDALFEIFRADYVPKRLDDDPVVVDLAPGETAPVTDTENIPEQLF